MKTRSIILFILSMLMASCVTEVEFRGDYTEPLLVVNAIATVGDRLNVDVTKSNFIMGHTDRESHTYIPIANADVQLIINGLAETLKYDSNSQSYKSDYVVRYNDSLDLRIEADGMLATSSIRVIGHAVEFAQCDTTILYQQVEYDYNGADTIYYYNAEMRLDFSFLDPANELNWYMVGWKNVFDLGDSQINYGTTWCRWDLDKPSATQFDLSSEIDELLGTTDNRAIADGIHDGTTFNNSQRIYWNYSTNQFEQPLQKCWIQIELCSIDKHYYHYLQSANANASTSDIFTLFMEPVQVYNNIEGGIGIFCSRAISKQQFYIMN